METVLKGLVLFIGLVLVAVFAWEGVRRLRVWLQHRRSVKADYSLETETQAETAPSEVAHVVKHTTSQVFDKHLINLSIESKGAGFDAKELFALFNRLGLQFNAMKIFEARAKNSGDIHYYITAATASGSFNISNKDTRVSAINLFAEPADQVAPRDSFFKLLEDAHKIAHALNGRILNMKKQPLTEESIYQDYFPILEQDKFNQQTDIEASA